MFCSEHATKNPATSKQIPRRPSVKRSVDTSIAGCIGYKDVILKKNDLSIDLAHRELLFIYLASWKFYFKDYRDPLSGNWLPRGSLLKDDDFCVRAGNNMFG